MIPLTTSRFNALTKTLAMRLSRRTAVQATGIGVAAGLLGTRGLVAFAQDATPAASPVSDAVVLINMFEVPANLEDAFLAEWHQVGEYTKQQAGFISTRLHRSLDPKAQFRFINVVQWRSAGDVQRALSTDEFKRLTSQVPVTAHPVLYQVIAE